jgi:formate hydrogenlyase subunit 3/multisubunit Na+/H+ antiporter MnhD subunit
MDALQLEMWAILALLGAALLALILSRRPVATSLTYGLALALSVVALANAGVALITGPAATSSVTLPLGLPWLGMRFHLDVLAAFFLVVVNLGGAVASLYGLGYGRHESSPHRVLPFFTAFLAGMNLVVVAADAFAFLLSWEFMSLVSWALVMSHHRETGNARAGYVYLVMASFGTLALLLAFGLMAGPQGAYGFAAIKAMPHAPAISALVLGLVLVGAGSKAGLVPLHVWLPLAHPAAPSHVSALMSGVMTKVAVYAFVRVVFDLIGEPGWWLSALVLILGGITAVLGILQAMLERDLKRLLAYSTIENIGLVFIGLGLALAFRGSGLGVPAALAFTGAMFHVLNHSLFKSLLFMGAGAVLNATGERDIERLGGLIHRMPRTAVAVLVGCLAISALPPFNGFVSEWLGFQAVLQSPLLPDWGLKVLVPAIGGLMAMTAALVAAAFVKMFGIAFLGRPRSEAAERASETDGFSVAALLLLAALCLIAGVLPGVIIDALAPVSQMLVGSRIPVQAAEPWLSIAPIAETRSTYDGMLVLAFILISGSTAAYLIHRLASRAVRRGPAWGCGFPEFGPLAQYSGASFAQPIRRIFATLLLGARDVVDMPPPGDTRPARLVVTIVDPAWTRLYLPLTAGVGRIAERLNRLQFLTIRQYLSLVFAALITLLLVLALWR